MTDIAKELAIVQKVSRCLLDSNAVEQMLDVLATAISEKCADKNPVILCVMTGAVVAVGQLLTRLKFPLELDYVHVTRYQNGTDGGELEWIQKPRISLMERSVVIIDDVLDEGVTLQSLLEYCKNEGAKSCYSAVLVNKDLGKLKPVVADFIGFQTGADYLYGLGMDYKGYLRNTPGIYACPENLEEILCPK
ncbi:MAG: hypoxanthine-guanine phosphoribosyltransferase [Piscirickettsiaceae bacterium]|nr:MAG: hypoxanthine-guanine phosphoribosyltransferase [Piscirickettsiaceae bacterium]